MMRLVPFEPAHLGVVEAQPAQRPYMKFDTPQIAEAAAAHFSFTGIDETDDAIVGCAGVAEMETGALVAWAVFSERLERHALAVTRAVRRGLALYDGLAVEAMVAADHVRAAVFVERLNFAYVRRMTHPNGAELLLYRRER